MEETQVGVDLFCGTVGDAVVVIPDADADTETDTDAGDAILGR
jgi:hypothetical protein